MIQELHDGYGFLFEKELLNEIEANGFLKEVKAGDKLIDFGNYIKHMPLLLTGSIKIIREDSKGDELLLYFLERGDTCAMTMTCCLGETKSEIKAIAEQDATLILIPVAKMDEWITRYKSWRNFVFDSYNNRLKEMLEAIDNLAFMKLNERLHKYLSDKVKVTGDTMLTSTHQEIAYELNSSRVVISRLLKQLEKEGKITLHRNRIEVIEY